MITREQIEELGWTNVEANIYVLGDKPKYESMYGGRPHMELLKEGEILITRGFRSYQGVPQGVIFRGKMVTESQKQELETIMKQIGII